MNIGKSIKNVGSKATSHAAVKAEKVSMGANRPSVRPPTPVVMPKPMRRQIHPGSAAGLKNQKSVHLNMNGTGYLNPANQTARYNKRVIQNPKVNVTTSVGFPPRNRNFDVRPLKSNFGSVKMLRERM